MEENIEQATSAELVLADRIETAVQKLEPEVISKIQSLTLKLKTTDGQELEIPISEINMGSSARPAQEEMRFGMKTGPQIGWLRCGNCLTRLPRYADQTINHHIGQEHKLVCTSKTAAAIQHRDLLEDFRRQEDALDENTKALRAQVSNPERPFLSADSPKRIGGADELKTHIAAEDARLAEERAREEAFRAKASKFVWWKPWTWF